MSKRIAVYFEKDDYWEIQKKLVMNNDKPLSQLIIKYLKKYYIENKNPEIKVNTFVQREGKEIHRYDLNIPEKLNEKFQEKLALMNHKNEGEVINQILKKHYLGEDKTMNLIQEIKQDDFKIKVYYTDNINLDDYDLGDYKIAQIVFSFLDKFKEMVKFKDKFNFKVEGENKNYIFTYTDELLLLVDIRDKGKEENTENVNEDDIIVFD